LVTDSPVPLVVPPGGSRTAPTVVAAQVLSVTSRLESRWHAVLERLLFFNDGQQAVRAQVVAAIERFGGLRIVADRGSLRLELERLPEAQTLYCILPDGRPVGCLVYSRDEAHRFLVLHVAVEPAYSVRGSQSGSDVLLRLVGAVRGAAQLTRGVDRVDLLYAEGRPRSFKVRSTAGAG
jgi:hypothetical protein